MSFAGSRQCKCPRYSFNVDGRPKRELVVIQRHQNRSSWNGHEWDVDRLQRRQAKSRWSHVLCLSCGHHWRTQAKYVDRLPDLGDQGWLLCCRGLKEGKPAGRLLLARIHDVYNRPLFGSETSTSASSRARFSPAKSAIGGR